MSDVDEPVDVHDLDIDDNAHQACYVFNPFDAEHVDDREGHEEIDQRPSKRQKIRHLREKKGSHANSLTSFVHGFPTLDHGLESDVCKQARWKAFSEIHDRIKTEAKAYLADLDKPVLDAIVQFARNTDVTDRSAGRVRAGLVVSGPGTAYQTRLQEYWYSTARAIPLATSSAGNGRGVGKQILIDIPFNACPNLQTSLRNIIKRAVLAYSAGADDDSDHKHTNGESYAAFISKHKKLIPQNFDLELLQLFAAEHTLDRIVVSIPDVESFDTSILTQLLLTLSMWTDRIPFVLLFGIATTVNLLEARLASSVVECMDVSSEDDNHPHIFTMPSPNDLYSRVFRHLHSDTTASSVFLGPHVVSALNELIQNQGTTVDMFIDALSTAYMAHFYANSLSALVKSDAIKVPADQMTLCTAIRRTHSFQRYCEYLIAQNNKKARRTLSEYLTDDAKLWRVSVDSVAAGREAMRKAVRVVAALHDLHERLPLGYGTHREPLDHLARTDLSDDVDLYKHLDDLTKSKTFRAIVAALEDMSTTLLIEFLSSVTPDTRELFQLDESIAQSTAIKEPTPRASARAKNAHATSNATTSFQSVVIDQLMNHIKGCSVDLCSGDTFLHEAYIINSRQPVLSYMTPRPRHVLERALGKPVDYLGCPCCDPDNDDDDDDDDDTTEEPVGDRGTATLKTATQPPTSILYHLLQEAGTTINVRDLFDAFRSRLLPTFATTISVKGIHEPDPNIDPDLDPDRDHDQDSDGNEKQPNTTEEEGKHRDRLCLALFYRALSELKMLGMVKSSTSTMTKKRVLAQNGAGGAGGPSREPGQRGRGKKAYADIDFVAKTSWAGL